MQDILKLIKKFIPSPIKRIFKNFKFKIKYGFWPPPEFTDMSGYEILLDAIIQHRLFNLDGDIVEIGCFLGGGTYKLAKLFERFSPNKKIYAIDIFDPNFDKTTCTEGKSMAEIYAKILKGRTQFEIYKDTIKNCKNIVTIVSDSKKINELPCSKIVFAYIDGNHSPEYVRNDFHLVWKKIVPNGVVAFDDYGYDLPQVTETINQLIGEHYHEILKIWTAGTKTIFIQKK